MLIGAKKGLDSIRLDDLEEPPTKVGRLLPRGAKNIMIRAVFFCIVSTFVRPPAVLAQASPGFAAHLRDAPKNFALWRMIVNGPKLERLPIDYAKGQVIEKYRNAFEGDLSLAETLAENLKRHPSLADEITFVSTAQSLVSQLQDMATFIVATPLDRIEDQRKMSLYAQSLTTLAQGQVEELYEAAYKDSVLRAKRADQACVGR